MLRGCAPGCRDLEPGRGVTAEKKAQEILHWGPDLGGEWLDLKSKFGALAAIVPETRECQLRAVSGEGRLRSRRWAAGGDRLWKGWFGTEGGRPPCGGSREKAVGTRGGEKPLPEY